MAIRSLLLIALGLLGLAVLIERLVVTDQEAITALVGEAESAFNEGRFRAFSDILAPEFDFGGRDRDATIGYLERQAKRFQAAGVDVVLDEPVVDGDEAHATGRVRLRVLNQFSVLPVSLRFARVDGAWRIKQASLDLGGR